MPEELLEQQEEQTPLATEVAEESDVQIELESDGAETPAEQTTEVAAPAPSPEPKKKVRKGNSADDRIARLTKEISDAASYAAEKEREANEYKSLYLQTQEQNKFLTEANIASYAKDADDKLARAKLDLKRAIETGDTDAAVDAQERLAEAKALQGQVATYKVQQRSQTPTKQPSTQVQQGDAPRRNPVADAWIAKNSWIKDDSEEFNPEKAQDALTYAENYASELTRQGRGAEIGTQRYFKMIDAYIKETWEDEEEVTNAAPPTKKAGSPVASQTRGAVQPTKQEQQRITLSPAEQQIAIMLNLRDENGNVLSKEEHFKAYARSKAADGRHAARDAAMAQRR